MTLKTAMKALTDSKDDRTRNMSEPAIRTADAAFMHMAESLVPMFVNDEGVPDMAKLGGVKVAAMFFAEMLQEMAKHPEEEVVDLLANGV